MANSEKSIFENGKRVHALARRTQQAAPRTSLGKSREEIRLRRANRKESLADLFAGRSQLLVYHFMLGPDWVEGCPSCSFLADHFDGAIPHLNARDVTFLAISRAPLSQIQAFQERMGWKFKWVSSNGTDFNFDYKVSFTPEDIEKGAPNSMSFIESAATRLLQKCTIAARKRKTRSNCSDSRNQKKGRQSLRPFRNLRFPVVLLHKILAVAHSAAQKCAKAAQNTPFRCSTVCRKFRPPDMLTKRRPKMSFFTSQVRT